MPDAAVIVSLPPRELVGGEESVVAAPRVEQRCQDRATAIDRLVVEHAVRMLQARHSTLGDEGAFEARCCWNAPPPKVERCIAGHIDVLTKIVEVLRRQLATSNRGSSLLVMYSRMPGST